MNSIGAIEALQAILGLAVMLSSAGIIITARDFYKLKSDIDERITTIEVSQLNHFSELKNELDNRYISKELHSSEIAGLKDDLSAMVTNQKDMQNKIDKIYNILIERISGSHG